MKLNPKQAPLYGECVLTVQLSEEECVEEDVEFYLLFSGSTQRHLTTTLRLSHVTLQTVCPAHNHDETVRVTLCQARAGGSIDLVAEERFQFVHDLALDMAHFLISAAAHRDGLEGALLLADAHVPSQECERLDETLTLALKHLPLPPGWSVLGPDVYTNTPTDFSPHETLLHFAARRGLRRVALFLLQQPGGRDALQLANKHGHTPSRVAQSKGHTQLQHLLTELEKSQHLETKAARRIYSAGRTFLHHPRLNTFTLTVEKDVDDEPPDLKRDIEELRHYAHSQCHNKRESQKQRQSFPVILSREFVSDFKTDAGTHSEDSYLQKPLRYEHQEVDTKVENGKQDKCPKGGTQSQEGDVLAPSGNLDSGTQTLGIGVEGVYAGKREDCVAVNVVSCSEQQEIDSEPRVIREAPYTQRSHAVSDTETHNKIQSGNIRVGTMGQTHGLLPEKGKRSMAKRDLPEEREGECDSRQETVLPTGNIYLHEKNSEKCSCFYVNLDVNATEKGLEIQETGNSNERVHGSAGYSKRDQELGESLDSPSFRPNMVPGPVHTIPLESSLLVKESHDEATGDQIDDPPEMASCYSEQVGSESIKEPSACDIKDTAKQPDRLLLDVSLTTEESGGDIQIEQTLLPATEEISLQGLKREVQPMVSTEMSAPDVDQISSSLIVSPSKPKETGSDLETMLEKEPLPFQTPPESPCEFFSVDGFIRTSDSNEACLASLEQDHPADSSETMKENGKVEAELLEMCERFKKSPLTVLCSSFSNLIIGEIPLDPQLGSTNSENITIISESSSAHPSEMREIKEEVLNLELNHTEKYEQSETLQVVNNKSTSPQCDSASQENLGGSSMNAYLIGSEKPNDQPPEFKDVQEDGMKVPPQVSENSEILSLPCKTITTDPHSEVINCEKKLSDDPKPDLTAFNETNVESALDPSLEVINFREKIPEQHEAKAYEECIGKISLDPHQDFVTFSGETIVETFLDFHHDPATFSEESVVETSLDLLTKVKVSEESIEDQQPKVTISEESTKKTSVASVNDLTSVETMGATSSLVEVISLTEKSIQQFEESRNEESSRGTHDLIRPFQETIKVSFVPFPDISSFEENVQPQQQQAMTTEESIGGTYLSPSQDFNISFKEEIGVVSFLQFPEVNSTVENVLDQHFENTASKKSINRTSQDPKLEVTTSENNMQGPHKEAPIAETVLDQQFKITTVEERSRETYHTQLEEATNEANLKISLEPPLEVTCSKMETRLPESSVQNEGAFLESSDFVNDSGLTLESVFISSSFMISDHSLDLSSGMDLESGSGVHMDAISLVGVDSEMLIPFDFPPLDSVCVHKTGSLVEEESRIKQECEAEPNEEQAAGDVDTEVKQTHVDQCNEIHREEEEVLNSLISEKLKQECSKENIQTDVPDATVCRSMPTNSLPGFECVDDGDLLLGPDNTTFKQNEDLTMSKSISIDDSSTKHTEEEEQKDQLTEVLECSPILRSTSRSQSPSRRHSWEPNKNLTIETDMGQRSLVQGEEAEKSAGHRRSMSWCPSHVPRPEMEMNSRSYSLEGLAAEDEVKMPSLQHSTHASMMEREERGSLASLTEEENENIMGDNSSLDNQRSVQDVGSGFIPPYTLTKSMSMSAINPKDLDDFTCLPSTAAAGSVECSISEEDPAPLKRVSRTFSYLKNKMSKKSKEKERDKNKDGKEKEKKSSNGHLFSSTLTPPPSPCLQCNRPISPKDALTCTNCSVHIHKGCRDGVPSCTKVKLKQQETVTDSAVPPGVLSRGKSASARERPWSSFMVPEDQVSAPLPPRKNPTIMPFNSGSLSKSMSISNIAGQVDDAPLKALKILSQSTDSLNKMGKMNESTELLTDEGTELMDGHLLVEFETDVKELEADSWSFTVEKKYLKQLKQDVIKRQDVIYELIQTEMHHMRTLRIMADVYSKGLQKEVQVDIQTLEKMFPMLEELLDLHTHFLTHLLERRREAREEHRGNNGGFVIHRIGDVLLDQMTGFNADKIKKVYGKFCSRHNEAVNAYKELHTRDKRFQAFIKKKMSSAVVRRLSIPECILLVTQRITKYPVLLQRLLQYTREPEEQADVAEALQQVKEVLTSVDSKVNEYEKRRRLKEVYNRTDSKSIMRMKSGQMFAREDLIRGRKLLHDGPLQVKNAAGRLKDVQALLLSDVFVFLQEKDQKYVFASLDQRSTVISLQKLIVREVANEERGLFFITAGIAKPEMVEVHVSSKDERNTWMQLIQNAANSTDKDDDEGVPSENEEEKRLNESKAKEMRDQLQKKDEQIVTLLEEKVRLFRELCDCTNQEDTSLRNRMLFRATSDVMKGEPIIKDALKEVETLQEMVTSSVVGQQMCVGHEESSVGAGSVSLPRRAETFGGFDCHQMNISKNVDREEADDLRRTESDSVLKKGGTANLLLLHKRNSEQVLQSVTHLHDLLNTLQAVVVQQDTFIEEQRQTLSSLSLRHPSISSLSSVSSLSSCSSRPSSLMEQEKQRQEEKIREEEKRRREEDEKKKREEDEDRRKREEDLRLREERLLAMEEETQRRCQVLQQEQQELKNKKEDYQKELLRLRDDLRRLKREKEQLHTQQYNMEDSFEQRPRTSSTASEDSLKFPSLTEVPEAVEVFSRADSKRKAKNLNPFSSSGGQKVGAVEAQCQIPSCLLQLTKTKDKKEKKKKKGKGGQQSQATVTETLGASVSESCTEKDVFFC